uniref:Alpha-1,2-Mannosidase n=1 Tax=Mesocestoides corti TaxID=53468 RepID=A0A5K3F520_MESCO
IDSHSVLRSLQPPTQGSPFRSKSPAVQILNSTFTSTNIYLGLTSLLGLDDITTPMRLSSEVDGCVHALSALFLHRGCQGSLIGPELIPWTQCGSRPRSG